MTILVEPTITLRPLGGDAVQHFTKVYEEFEHPVIGAKGFDLVGAWTKTSGTVGQIAHLYRFDDLTAYDASRRAMREDPEFMAKLLPAYGPDVTIRETVACGQPLPHVQLDRAKELGPDDENTLYVRVTLRVELRDLARIVPLIAQAHAGIEADTSMQLVAAYMPTFGDRNEIVVVWRLPQGEESLREVAAVADKDVLAELVALLDDEAFEFMRSLPYSPTSG